MAKGVYTVQEGNEHPKSDSSFYACTTALLIFLILIIIIITVPLVYQKISETSNLKRLAKEEPQRTEKVAGSEGQKGLETTGETESSPVLTGDKSTSVRTPEETTAEGLTKVEKLTSPATYESVSREALSFPTTRSSTANPLYDATTTHSRKSDTSWVYYWATSNNDYETSQLDTSSSTRSAMLEASSTANGSVKSHGESRNLSTETEGITTAAQEEDSDKYDTDLLPTWTDTPPEPTLTTMTESYEKLTYFAEEVTATKESDAYYIAGQTTQTDTDVYEYDFITTNSSLSSVPAEITANETTGDASTSSQTTPENENYSLAQYNTSNTVYSDVTTTPSNLIGTTQNNTAEYAFIYSSRNTDLSANNSDTSTTDIYHEDDTVFLTSSVSYESHIDTTLPTTGELDATISTRSGEITDNETSSATMMEEFNSTDPENEAETTSEIHRDEYKSYNSTDSIVNETYFYILNSSNTQDKNSVTPVYSDNDTFSISSLGSSSEHAVSTETSFNDWSNSEGDDESSTLEDYTTDQPVTNVSYKSVHTTTEITNLTVLKTLVQEEHGICETSECKLLASRMLSFMNHSTDPCADFYEYACGGLRSNEALLQYDPKKDVWRRIHDRMKKSAYNVQSVYNPFAKFYDSCMSYDENMVKKDRVVQARAILDSVGKFHDNTTWIDNQITFTDLIYTLLTYHSSPLFDVLLDVDDKDPSRFSLKLVTPIYKSFFQKDMSPDEVECEENLDLKQTQLDLNEQYESYTNCRLNFYSKYLKTIEDALKEFGISRDDNAKDISEILMFIEYVMLSEVKKSLPSDGEMRRTYIAKEYTVMTVSELQQTFTLVDWTNLFSRILDEQSISPNTAVQVYFKDFLTKLFNELTGIDQRTLHNALLAMFAHDLYADLVKMRNPCGRAEYCLQVASDLMTDLSSGLYLETFSEDDLFKKRTKVDSMFDNLKMNLRDQLQNSYWLDETSKDQAIKKLDNLTLVNDGGKHVFSNQEFMKDRMNIEMNPKNYLNNSVELLKRYRRLMYSVYHMDPRQSNVIWTHFILPYSTESIAIYGTNMIVIPYGATFERYPTVPLVSHVDFAETGVTVARAMLHHYDETGIKYSTAGRREYAVLSSQNIDDYAHYAYCVNSTSSEETTVVLPNGNSVEFKMDPPLSLNERLSDQAAVKLALETYRASVNTTQLVLPWLNMNWQQLYFLSLAQTFCVKDTLVDDVVGLFENEHLPPPIRVNKMMEHSEEFSSANVFSCAHGSNMNPEPKCDAFPHMTLPVFETKK